MAVKTIDEYRCARCPRLKGALNHWWLVKVDGAVYSVRDFAEQALEDFDYALCSLECLSKDFREHTDKLLRVKTAAGHSLTPDTRHPEPESNATGEA